MHLTIELYITAVNWTNGEYFVVSFKGGLPEFHPPVGQLNEYELGDKDCNVLEIAQELYEQAVTLDKNWCNIHLYDAIIGSDKSLDNSEMTLVYLAHIPYDVELKEPYVFMSTKDLNNEYITESIRRIA